MGIPVPNPKPKVKSRYMYTYKSLNMQIAASIFHDVPCIELGQGVNLASGIFIIVDWLDVQIWS